MLTVEILLHDNECCSSTLIRNWHIYNAEPLFVREPSFLVHAVSQQNSAPGASNRIRVKRISSHADNYTSNSSLYNPNQNIFTQCNIFSFLPRALTFISRFQFRLLFQQMYSFRRNFSQLLPFPGYMENHKCHRLIHRQRWKDQFVCFMHVVYVWRLGWRKGFYNMRSMCFPRNVTFSNVTVFSIPNYECMHECRVTNGNFEHPKHGMLIMNNQDVLLITGRLMWYSSRMRVRINLGPSEFSELQSAILQVQDYLLGLMESFYFRCLALHYCLKFGSNQLLKTFYLCFTSHLFDYISGTASITGNNLQLLFRCNKSSFAHSIRACTFQCQVAPTHLVDRNKPFWGFH